MSRSGWCTGPESARLKCEQCRWSECDHECHNEKGTD